MKSKQLVSELLEHADIKINGDRPWDIQVHNDKMFDRIISNPSLGLGESYMDGWWDCEELDTFFFKTLGAKLQNKIKGNLKLMLWIATRVLINKQTKKKAKEVGEVHYDAGNDLYEKMLDKRMVYTCAYWKDAKTLDEAQEAKLDLVCKKVGLKPGMKVLDIGCGWGSFLQYAAEKYGIEGVGVTISKEQVALGKERVKGLPIDIRLQDYRDVTEKFDVIVSLGMFEHVGPKNYKTFMKQVDKNLKDDGLFLLHTIGKAHTEIQESDPWYNKYIFPNGVLPAQEYITKAIDNIFVLEDWHNFGVYYDKTLLEWNKNFIENWDVLKSKYDNRFFRMWKYYLLMSAGSFRARHNQLWQIVLSKKGVKGGYGSIR